MIITSCFRMLLHYTQSFLCGIMCACWCKRNWLYILQIQYYYFVQSIDILQITYEFIRFCFFHIFLFLFVIWQ
jgi:hypothetical protein